MQQKQTASPAAVDQRDVGRLYDRLAGAYDVWGRATESRARARALEQAAVRNGEHVLEVAVGTGLAFVEIVRRNPDGRNVGIDLSQGMLSKARRRLRTAGYRNFDLSVGSALDIKQATGSFDVVLNNYMFDLLDERDWPRVLGEFHRVLKPDGRLVLINMTFGETFGSGIYERIYRLDPRLLGGCRSVQLAPVLERNGFAVQSREYFQQLLFPSEVILADRRQ